MPVYEIEVRGQRYEIDAPDDAAASNAARNLASQPQHREFDPSNVPGRSQPSAQFPRTTSALMGGIEGLPIVGPAARQGVEATASGIGSVISGQPYEKVRGEIGGMAEEAVAQHPYIHGGGQLVGGILGTAPAVMAAPSVFGAGAGGLLARSAAGMASGATLGGADTAARGGDPRIGAALGGITGGLGPAAGDLIGAGTRAIASRLGGRSGSAAQRLFGQAAGADDLANAGPRLSAMGDEAMAMDLGPNLRSYAGAVGNRPGRGQEIVRSAVGGRQGRAGARVSGALDDALGQPVDTIATADEIIARRAATAKPLYDAAYSKPVPFTRELESLLKRPAVGRALQKAQGLAADEGIPSQQWFANIADDGTVTIKRVPDVRQLDLTKRALDDMISAAQRTGNNNEARILTQQKNLLTGMIDDAVPEYAQARQAFSGPASVLDAMEEGQSAFRNTLTPNQLRTKLAKMGEAEKEAYVQGARAQIADMMGTARNDALRVRGEFQKGYNQEKLEMLVGKEQAARLLQNLEAETAFAATNKEITQQSVTAGRQQANKALDTTSEPGILRSLDISRPGETLGRIGDRIAGRSRAAAQETVNEELAQLLTSRNPENITRMVQMVQAAQRRGDITAQRSKEIVQSLMLSAGQRRPLEITIGRPSP